MKKVLVIFIYLLGLVLLAEVAARTKLSLQTNNYRYFLYFKGAIKNQPQGSPLLKPLTFKKTGSKVREAIFIGTSVWDNVRPYLEQMLKKDGWQQFSYIDGRKQQSIEYGDNSIIVMETMILPAINNDFFNSRNKIRQLLGASLYDNLYNNSVFFLMLSEKLTGAVTFSTAAKQEFIKETTSAFEKTFENIQVSSARVLLVNFPNFFLRGEEKVFGIYCGQVADMAAKSLEPLVDRYAIHYLDIYTLHNDEFKRQDFTDHIHLNNDGGKRAASYIFEAIKTLT